MDIKVTFTIETRLSDETIKAMILNNHRWSFSKPEDVNVWSPALHIFGGCNVNDSNEPHTVYIDICHDPDFQDFDELSAFIEGELEHREPESKDLGHPRYVADSATHVRNPNVVATDMRCKYVARLKRMKKSELKEPDMYYFAIEHVKEGITLSKIEEIISKKLEEEYTVFSSIVKDVPSFESVDAFRNGNDGAIVYIMAHCRFFDWLGFENLKAFAKENIEKADKSKKVVRFHCIVCDTVFEIPEEECNKHICGIEKARFGHPCTSCWNYCISYYAIKKED